MRLSGIRAIAPLLTVAGLGGTSLAAAAASASPATAVPADLQTLVERSQHLQVPYLISTEREGFRGGIFEVIAPHRGRTPALLSVAEQARATPAEVEGTIRSFDLTSHVRYVRGELYSEPPREIVGAAPGLLSRMHGRRWIRLTRRELARKPRPRMPAPINPVAPNPLAPTGLAPLVAIERNIVESGPVEVDGQQVTSFTGTVDPAQLSKAVHVSFSGLEAPASVNVVLDIAPDGLLKRITLTGTGAATSVYMIGEVLSISTPVAVHVPWSGDTIDAATLSRAQRQDLNL